MFDKGIISEQDFNNIQLRYNQDVQNLENANSDLQIIKLGSIGGAAVTNTLVRSTVKGTVLVVPVKEGDQVKVKVIGVDDRGKVKLSIKDV